MLVQILSIIAMSLAVYGSKLFVDSKFELGSKLFIISNSINILIGLTIGNLYLSIAQLGLLVFTLPMVKINTNKIFYSLVIISFIALLSYLPIHFGFKTSIIDTLSTLCAWFGAYKMYKGDFSTMAKCWIVADIGFLYIGLSNHLIGLSVQAFIFVYHGYKRLVK